MSSSPGTDTTVRDRILSDPEAVLEDQDVMRALIAANEETMGANIVDLRGVAMKRLEARLDRLEDTHRSVIAAAYDNLSGTNQIHRAILRMMEAPRFEDVLTDLAGDVADILHVDSVRLVLETAAPPGDLAVSRDQAGLCLAAPGFVDAYIAQGTTHPARQVTLRQVRGGDERLFGDTADRIRSEACLRLDLGADRPPGMLVLGAADPQQFTPQQGTDLLAFFAGVLERLLRRWPD